jgi:hypothetical protein
VAGCCECGDEPSGSCAMELVKDEVKRGISLSVKVTQYCFDSEIKSYNGLGVQLG